MNPRLRRTVGRTYYDSPIEDFVAFKYPSDIVDYLIEGDEFNNEYELHQQKKLGAIKLPF